MNTGSRPYAPISTAVGSLVSDTKVQRYLESLSGSESHFYGESRRDHPSDGNYVRRKPQTEPGPAVTLLFSAPKLSACTWTEPYLQVQALVAQAIPLPTSRRRTRRDCRFRRPFAAPGPLSHQPLFSVRSPRWNICVWSWAPHCSQTVGTALYAARSLGAPRLSHR